MSIFRLFFVVLILYSCNVSKSISKVDSFQFPQSWEGKWKGDLEIFSGKGKKQTLEMELHILPIDSIGAWSWTIIYGTDKEKGKRSYILKPKDVENGIYAVDEQNSIVLDAYLLDKKLVERFEVMNNLLITSTELRGDVLVWEILVGSLNNLSVTGDTIVGKDTIPQVKGYPVTILQRAYLKKY